MLSFKIGKPIAVIIDGKHNGKLLRLDESIDIKSSDVLTLDELQNFIIGEIVSNKEHRNASLSEDDVERLKYAIKDDIEPKIARLKNIYRSLKQELEKRMGRDFRLISGSLFPTIFNIIDNDTLCAFGMKGVGKTTFIANRAQDYSDLLPKNKIYLFSRKVYLDPVFDNVRRLEKIDIFDPEFVLNKFTLEELSNSLCIFDDITNIDNKKISDEVYRLRNDILENGRQLGISCYCTNHQIFDGNKTKTLIKESTSYVIFTNDDIYHIKKLLREHLGFTSSESDRIIKLKSRWVFISRTVPKYIVYEFGAFIL